jgi:hypothetical protein
MGISYRINLLIWLPMVAGLLAFTLRKRSMNADRVLGADGADEERNAPVKISESSA